MKHSTLERDASTRRLFDLLCGPTGSGGYKKAVREGLLLCLVEWWKADREIGNALNLRLAK